MTTSNQTVIQSQTKEMPANKSFSYHTQAHDSLNNSGIFASSYALLLHVSRAAARLSLTADATVYKSCDKAIEALNELTLSQHNQDSLGAFGLLFYLHTSTQVIESYERDFSTAYSTHAPCMPAEPVKRIFLNISFPNYSLMRTAQRLTNLSYVSQSRRVIHV